MIDVKYNHNIILYINFNINNVQMEYSLLISNNIIIIELLC